MKKIMLIIILPLIILVGCTNNSDAKTFKKEYESLNNITSENGKEYLNLNISSHNIIKYATIDEVINLLNNSTGVIYFGYPKCPWCRLMISPLLEAADSTPLETIYYLNMEDIRDTYTLKDGNPVKSKEGSSQYPSLLQALDDILDDYVLKDSENNEIPTGEKRIYVPLVVFVQNGIIVDYQSSVFPNREDPYLPLTTDEENELITIYKEKISKITNGSCNSDEERC